MTNLANDLHMKNAMTKDPQLASHQLVLQHPAAIIAAANTQRSQELARILGNAGKAIANLPGFSFKAIRDAYRFKKSVAELEALSDRELLDIGLKRETIGQAVRSAMEAAKKQKPNDTPRNRPVVKDATATRAANCNTAQKHHLAA